MYRRLITLLIAVLASQGAVAASSSTSTRNETSAERTERMAWFKEARFGMFIHWGVYSVLGGTYQGAQIPGIGEWIMQSAAIPVDEYETYATIFIPASLAARTHSSASKNCGLNMVA